MEEKQAAPIVQEQPANTTVETTAPVPEVPSPAAAAPAAPPAAAPAPPQADQAPKGKDAQARINQLIARAKFDEEALDTANAEIARLKAERTAPAAAPAEGNPYTPPAAPAADEEVKDEDLDGLPPVVRQLVLDHKREVQDRAREQKLSELETAIGKGFEDYPEIKDVDDNAIILEMKTRRVPVFNADLVFASQSLPVVRQQRDAALKRVAELEAELNKDTVAAPVNGSVKPAPPDGAEKVYAPGEKMAEARRKAAEHH